MTFSLLNAYQSKLCVLIIEDGKRALPLAEKHYQAEANVASNSLN